MVVRVLPFISLNLFNHRVKHVVVSSICRENKGSEEPDPKLLPTVSRTDARYTCRTCLSFYPEIQKKEGLYKKDLHYTDNHNGMITHLEPDILEFKVK